MNKIKTLNVAKLERANDRIDEANWIAEKLNELNKLKGKVQGTELELVIIEIAGLTMAYNAIADRLTINGIELSYETDVVTANA